MRYFVNVYEKSTLPAPPDGKGDDERSGDDGKAEIDDETREAVRLSGREMPSPGQVYRADIATDDKPHTYNEVMKRSDADLWYKVMQDEQGMFEKIGLYEEVECPRDCKVINLKWVFKIKRGPNGEIEKYKAQLIAKGFTQIHGIDYTDTFAPVTKFTTIRALLTLATKYNLEIHQMDMKSAFLNGELDEEIFLEPPPGFRSSRYKVWQLLCALYGLKQAHKWWYERLCAVFLALGFMRCQADHSVFHKIENSVLIIIAVYVDDKLTLSNNHKAIDKLKRQFAHEYDMTDLGEAHWILGMEIIRDHKKQTI